MNIIINEKEANILNESVFMKVMIGSHLYGTNNDNSDVDYLYIYETSKEELNSPLPNRHQFQYKDNKNNVDYIYTSLLQFKKNLLSGDATINADVILFSGEPLIRDFFREPMNICRTYKVIKAYLGFAKRDIKQIYKKNREKKIFHVRRGLYMAESLIDNQYPLLSDIINISKMDSKDYNLIKDLTEKERYLRNKLNEMYDKDEIQSYYVERVEDPILQKLYDSNNVKEFKY